MTSEPRPFAKTRTSETVLQRITAIRAPRLLRSLELWLVLLALAIGVASVVIIDLTVKGELSTALVPAGAFFVVAVLALHTTIRLRAQDADPLIMPIAVMLNSLGIAAIYRIDLAKNLVGWESVAVRQLVWSGIAIITAILVLWFIRNHLVLFRYTYLTGLLALVFLLLPMLPGIGRELNGARVWIGLGPFSFQPGEVAKILLAVFFAG